MNSSTYVLKSQPCGCQEGHDRKEEEARLEVVLPAIANTAISYQFITALVSNHQLSSDDVFRILLLYSDSRLRQGVHDGLFLWVTPSGIIIAFDRQHLIAALEGIRNYGNGCPGEVALTAKWDGGHRVTLDMLQGWLPFPIKRSGQHYRTYLNPSSRSKSDIAIDFEGQRYCDFSTPSLKPGKTYSGGSLVSLLRQFGAPISRDMVGFQLPTWQFAVLKKQRATGKQKCRASSAIHHNSAGDPTLGARMLCLKWNHDYCAELLRRYWMERLADTHFGAVYEVDLPMSRTVKEVKDCTQCRHYRIVGEKDACLSPELREPVYLDKLKPCSYFKRARPSRKVTGIKIRPHDSKKWHEHVFTPGKIKGANNYREEVIPECKPTKRSLITLRMQAIKRKFPNFRWLLLAGNEVDYLFVTSDSDPGIKEILDDEPCFRRVALMPSWTERNEWLERGLAKMEKPMAWGKKVRYSRGFFKSNVAKDNNTQEGGVYTSLATLPTELEQQVEQSLGAMSKSLTYEQMAAEIAPKLGADPAKVLQAAKNVIERAGMRKEEPEKGYWEYVNAPLEDAVKYYEGKGYTAQWLGKDIVAFIPPQ